MKEFKCILGDVYYCRYILTLQYILGDMQNGWFNSRLVQTNVCYKLITRNAQNNLAPNTKERLQTFKLATYSAVVGMKRCAYVAMNYLCLITGIILAPLCCMLKPLPPPKGSYLNGDDLFTP